MQANSSPVHSNQSGPHPRLAEIVLRHAGNAFQRPLREPAWWPALAARLQATPRRLLDLGCGTGESTLALAAADPGCLTVGIDASAVRLARGLAHVAPANAALLHGDSLSLLRLFANAGLLCERICLFYPNPWPKAAQLMRRWHGHPLFPLLLTASTTLELRCNWWIYAEEFRQAAIMLGATASLETWSGDGPAISPFERKYRASGHPLWRVFVTNPAQCKSS